VPTLYDLGLRQGSMIDAPLPLAGLVVDDQGAVVLDSRIHDRWIVATQDCDLVRCDVTLHIDAVELRPILTESPPPTRGIRARKFLLPNSQYLESESRRMMISPAAVRSLIEGEDSIDNTVANDIERRSEYKTWLGYRYDRPAVPDEYIPLARAIVDAIERHQGKRYTGHVRDIMVQFEPGDPPVFELFAVIMDEADAEDIENWLTGAAMGVSVTLGVPGPVRVETADNTPLSLIESSFAADVTQISWTSKGLRGEPGRLTRPMDN
jgi:hypothetical protein